MFISKMGSHHYNYGTNSQDGGFEFKTFRCVLDGCGSGEHSEVGAKLFSRYLLRYLKNHYDYYNYNFVISVQCLKNIFEHVRYCTTSFPWCSFAEPNRMKEYILDMKDYMCFTILFSQEFCNIWNLLVCGDGFLILEYLNGEIEFKSLEVSRYPVYLAYSYMDEKYLNFEGEAMPLGFRNLTFSKDYFKSIGLATDGLRYIIDTKYEDEFKELIKKRKIWKLKRMINKLNGLKNKGFFKDDVTITF